MAAFEDKLIALGGAENLKQGKQLLKQQALIGAWRDRELSLCGVFRSNGKSGEVLTKVTAAGDGNRGECSVCGQGICAHALALLMHCGRYPFRTGREETPPFYYGGIVRRSFEQLAAAGRRTVGKLKIWMTDRDGGHAPTRWENIQLSVKLVTDRREFPGNHSNLTKLYFEKRLNPLLEFSDFTLQDQQLIRFLAENGEACNSDILLSAPLMAELFHALPGFREFYFNGHRLVVHGEPAEPVLIRSGAKYVPGVLFRDLAIPMENSRIIEGESGSYIGKNGEYFFVGGRENRFLRDFFRCLQFTRESVPDFPLAIVNAGVQEPEIRTPQVSLTVQVRDTGGIMVLVEFIYSLEDSLAAFPPLTGIFARDGRNCWRRDRVFEENFLSGLELFGAEIDREKLSAVIADEEKAALWLDRALPEFLALYPDTRLSARLAAMLCGLAGLPPVTPRVLCSGIGGGSFQLQCSFTDPSGRKISPADAGAAAAEYRRYFRSGGSLFALEPAVACWLRSLPALVRQLDSGSGSCELPFCNLESYRRLSAGLPWALPPELTPENLPVLSSPPPAERFRFQGTLRSYQQEGVDFLVRMARYRFNTLLADEMGLGKTVQLLAVLAELMQAKRDRALLICPASLVGNWQREASRFVPEMRCCVPEGVMEREELLRTGDFDLLILSYAAAKLALRQLKKYTFAFLVLDEAQQIKNPASDNAKCCKSLNAVHRIVLTGTPVENRGDDLWSVMDFLHPGLLGTLPAFKRRYRELAENEELRLELQARTAPFIKRRTKAEVAADLPEKNEMVFYCDFTAEQGELYRRVLADSREALNRGENAAVFASLLRLRQICCHPALLPDGTGEAVSSGKTELLRQLLLELVDAGHKILLFSQFTSMLKTLIPLLEEEHIVWEYLDGSTKDRMRHVENFNNNPDIPLFLLSLKAGGTGLNLTSADTVILYDPWWNPAAEAQAADRTHRIGQTRPVTTIKLVMRDSIEEKVLALQEKKQRLFTALLEHPESASLSMEELRSLLD